MFKRFLIASSILIAIGFMLLFINPTKNSVIEEEKPKETIEYSVNLEELLETNKLITLEGITGCESDLNENGFLTSRDMFISAKYRFGYALILKDLKASRKDNNVTITIPKNCVTLEYVEPIEDQTNVFWKKDIFGKNWDPQEVIDLKKNMKNKVRISLYDEKYYETAKENAKKSLIKTFENLNLKCDVIID